MGGTTKRARWLDSLKVHPARLGIILGGDRWLNQELNLDTYRPYRHVELPCHDLGLLPILNQQNYSPHPHNISGLRSGHSSSPARLRISPAIML